ncbi:class I SAM-dependent methyltransferase [Zavarzinia sp.]|uniref:class I SAM-dependent methyltransferase n=1 Tax=Zavarzinia sp. TaxID=2027920 RepID=UPI0035655D00
MSLTSSIVPTSENLPTRLIELPEALRLPGLGLWLRLLLRLGARLDCGTLLLTLPDGRTVALRGQRPGSVAALTLHQQTAARRILLRGGLGFAESHVDGGWTTPDLTALLGLIAENRALIGEAGQGKPWMALLARLGQALNRNHRRGARRNIMAHYDLGNDFYAAWLDPGMTYSAAVFEATDDLLAAQEAKFRLLADKLRLRPDDHVLEIGCGWGGFAEHAAREHGARVTAITLSPAQFDHARRRIFEAGLAERVEIRLQDYRDTRGRFDKIASIEMFEAVGEAYWPVYFGRIRDLLAEGGRAALQVITIAEAHFPRYRRSMDFIQKYVFPGGMLPSPSIFEAEARAAGLNPEAVTRHGPDYARTLKQWRERFEASFERIRGLGFDDRFRRLWTYYLAYCEAGFRTGSTDVIQVTLTREIGERSVVSPLSPSAG